MFAPDRAGHAGVKTVWYRIDLPAPRICNAQCAMTVNVSSPCDRITLESVGAANRAAPAEMGFGELIHLEPTFVQSSPEREYRRSHRCHSQDRSGAV